MQNQSTDTQPMSHNHCHTTTHRAVLGCHVRQTRCEAQQRGVAPCALRVRRNVLRQAALQLYLRQLRRLTVHTQQRFQQLCRGAGGVRGGDADLSQQPDCPNEDGKGGGRVGWKDQRKA